MAEQAEPLLRPQEQEALNETRAMLQAIRRDLIRFIVRLLPAIIRMTCVSVAGAGLVFGTMDAWKAFGSDGAALIPALLLGIIPLLFAFVNGVRWGGMLASGAFSYATAQGLNALPFPFAQMLILIVLAALVVSEMARRGQPEEMEQSSNEPKA